MWDMVPRGHSGILNSYRLYRAMAVQSGGGECQNLGPINYF